MHFLRNVQSFKSPAKLMRWEKTENPGSCVPGNCEQWVLMMWCSALYVRQHRTLLLTAARLPVCGWEERFRAELSMWPVREPVSLHVLPATQTWKARMGVWGRGVREFLPGHKLISQPSYQSLVLPSKCPFVSLLIFFFFWQTFSFDGLFKKCKITNIICIRYWFFLFSFAHGRSILELQFKPWWLSWVFSAQACSQKHG